MIGYSGSTAVMWQLLVVIIDDERGLSTEAHCINQPNKSKLLLYKLLLSF